MTEASGDRVTWTYDAADRLVREARSGGNAYTVTHTYDPVGNRRVKVDGARTTFSYDAANQLRWQQDSTGRTTFSFDSNGNQTLQVTRTGARTTLVWDRENRLVQGLLPTGGRNTFSYNGDGKRVQRQDSSGLMNLIWDGQNILRETDNTGSTTVAYTLQPAGYGNLLSQRRSGATNFHLFDGLGSTERLVDLGGSTVESYLYEAFGTQRLSPSISSNRFRFVGRQGYEWDVDLAQYQLRARPYRPDLARFLAIDPLGWTGLLTENSDNNLYRYVRNNPLLFTDPSGEVAAGPILALLIVELTACAFGGGYFAIRDYIDQWRRGIPNFPDPDRGLCSFVYGCVSVLGVVNALLLARFGWGFVPAALAIAAFFRHLICVECRKFCFTVPIWCEKPNRWPGIPLR